jgi:hypothetical protein
MKEANTTSSLYLAMHLYIYIYIYIDPSILIYVDVVYVRVCMYDMKDSIEQATRRKKISIVMN